MKNRIAFFFILLMISVGIYAQKIMKIGIIGLDTSHSTAFTELINSNLSFDLSTKDDYWTKQYTVALITDNEEDVETVKEFLMTENYEIISENLPGSPTVKAPHILIDPNENRIKNIMVSLGLNGNDHNYTKVQQELNNNVSMMLNTTGNEQAKDRFIKATFLLPNTA